MMAIDVVIPELGESVTGGTVAAWTKADGDVVERDDIVMELETDKITMEVRAPAAGVLKHQVKAGDEVAVGAVVATVDESASGKPSASEPAKAAASNGSASAGSAASQPSGSGSSGGSGGAGVATSSDVRATPLARKLAADHGVDLAKLQPTGAGGKIREHDVQEAIGKGPGASSSSGQSASPAAKPAASKSPPPPPTGKVTGAAPDDDRRVWREKMSKLRQRIAVRLVEAQHNAAMLTTFNECDMSAVMDLRKTYKDSFSEKHGIGLGFMGFFVKAVTSALKAFPTVNASIVAGEDGTPEVEHHGYQDIAVAVGTDKGLVVPVLRNCDRLSFAQIESGIKDLATRARDGKLGLDDLQGGTFTITNGGIYGSLMSTPILNPPQTAILGMHAIKNRPMEHPAGSGQLAVRPMMYLALSYDHRLIDGAEAVQFLVHIKNAIEHPERLLLGL